MRGAVLPEAGTDGARLSNVPTTGTTRVPSRIEGARLTERVVITCRQFGAQIIVRSRRSALEKATATTLRLGTSIHRHCRGDRHGLLIAGRRAGSRSSMG